MPYPSLIVGVVLLVLGVVVFWVLSMTSSVFVHDENISVDSATAKNVFRIIVFISDIFIV
jgi:uncharacterized protein YqhQ